MSARRDNTAEQEAFAEAAATDGTPRQTGAIKFHAKGMPPLDEPVLAKAITDRLRSERVERALAHPTKFRCSDAYGCARKLAFSALGVPKDVAYSAESILAFAAGDSYHHIAQEAAVQAVDARCELAVDWTPRASVSGHADGVYRLAELKRLLPEDHYVLADLRKRGATATDVVCVEVKSMAGYGFRLAVGAVPGKSTELPGPKLSDLLQCGLYALSPSIAARWLHMVYISKDSNTTAEWLIGVDEPMGHLDGKSPRELVEAELDRMNTVAATIDAGDLPARDVPGFGIVQGDPPAAESRDNPWNCRYCSWQPTCAGLVAEVEAGWVATYLSTKEAAA